MISLTLAHAQKATCPLLSRHTRFFFTQRRTDLPSLRGKVRSTQLQGPGSFTDLDPNFGNGILWFVEGPQRSAFGNLPNACTQSFNLPNVIVSPGQVLYFIIDPKNGDYRCDTTMLDVTIDEVI